MTSLLIIIVSIQIILYVILIYSLDKMVKTQLKNHSNIVKLNQKQYEEYMNWRIKVRDLLTKDDK